MRTRLVLGTAAPAACVAAVLLLAPGPGMGQPRGPAPAPMAPPGAARTCPKPADAGAISVAIGGCQACHAGADTGQAAGFVKDYKSNTFVLLNESTTWGQKDIHSVAYTNLSGPLGQRMEKLLGYKVAEAPQCLTCHSVDLSPGKKDKTFPADFATKAGGVNCTVCHGFGKNWQAEHYEDPLQQGTIPWRDREPGYKYDKGMADLRDPMVKAQLCAACHVGNPDEGKVVTHEMYAAGHPPLQPFELATFMQSEPNHWGYPTDAKLKFFADFAAKKPDAAWPTFHFHPAEKESYLARHLACGAVASLQAEARLLAADATAAAKPDAATGVDYALFDCYACHHDLKYPSPRQKRGYEGAPGRPPLKAWVGALPGVVADHAAGLDGPFKTLAGDFDKHWPAVRKAAIARPFGDPGALSKSAADLDGWCEQFLQAQSKTKTPVYAPAQAQRLLGLIRDAAGSDRWSADTEAATHLTWAYLALRDEGKPVPKEKLDALDKTIATRVRYPADYQTAGGEKPKPIEAFLAERLKKFAAYDPAAFGQAFKEAVGGN